MLEFNTAFDKEILVIELEGSLDSHSASDFRSWFNEKIAAGYRAFAIDCLCLEFISSAGITALIDVQNILQNQNGKVVLFQLSGETRQLLRFLQLEKKMQLVADYDDAISALTGIKKAEKKRAPQPVPSGVEAMVDVGDLTVLPTSEKVESGEAEHAEAGKVETVVPVKTESLQATQPPGNEMLMEENFSAEKRGLHPMYKDPEPVAAAATARPDVKPAPVAQEIIPAPAAAEAEIAQQPDSGLEAREIKVNNTGAKRLIS